MSVRTGMYHFEVSRTAMYQVRYVLAHTRVAVHTVMYCLVPGVQDSRCQNAAGDSRVTWSRWTAHWQSGGKVTVTVGRNPGRARVSATRPAMPMMDAGSRSGSSFKFKLLPSQRRPHCRPGGARLRPESRPWCLPLGIHLQVTQATRLCMI